jgi:glycolate oxidase iron-sulfur subunit
LAPALAAADQLVDRVPLRFLKDHDRARAHQEEAILRAEHAYFENQQKLVSIKAAGKKVPESLLRAVDAKPQRPKIAYLPVCGSQYLRPSIGLATLELLQFLKLDFVIPDLLCCGLPAASYGMLESVREMAKENIKRLERGRYESVLADDSSCAAHAKEYPKFFQDDPDWLKRSTAVSQSVRELSSFLVQWGLIEHLKKAHWAYGPVAYHDPCKAQYGQKIVSPPRALLSAIVPIAEADQCCGGGGTYSFVHPDMSRDVLSRKIKNITDTQCRTVVTSGSSCLIQLASGLKKKGSTIEVLHLSEFLVRVLKNKK